MQGLAWVGLLAKSCPVFAAKHCEEVCGDFDGMLDMPLRRRASRRTRARRAAKLDETAYTQPALFAVEVALPSVGKSGVSSLRPLWASQGEIAAAAGGGRVVAERRHAV